MEEEEEEEVNSEFTSCDIIGESPALKRVLALAKKVAANNHTVLILGETGSGKESVARAIHRVSTRREGSFVKVGLSGVAPEHLESLLFGQRKDGLPGVTGHKMGRLQQAHRGTLFLDEIADLPLNLQPKLLRVLQSGELARPGRRTLRVDVRGIASTSVDLKRRVAEGRFYGDLYNHLEATSIRVPSLCERRDDIPMLVRYFVHVFARRMNKSIETIGEEIVNAVLARDWPGNVRELEHFIERSVALTEGSTLRLPGTEWEPESESGAV